MDFYSSPPLVKGHNYIGIPYLDVNGAIISRYVFAAGSEIPFRRVRLLDFTEKHGKYQSYASGGTAIYIPHDAQDPKYWDRIAIDPKIPIMLTEGEFDAISGCLLGIPTLGLSGLDCFMEKGKRTPSCPCSLGCQNG